MKKIVIILTTILSLCFTFDSFGAPVAHYLYCTRSGQAWIVDQLGNSVAAGGCANGPWAVQLDNVVPTGNPTVDEASDNVYEALNRAPSNPSAQPTQAELAEIRTAIQNNPQRFWINPLRLNSAAYALIYGGTQNLPLFYVNTSINSSNGNNLLKLYSNLGQNITVTYKRLDQAVITSEVISVSRGYNSKTLNTSSLPNGTYIITISTSENYSVNLTLYVNS